MEQNLVDALKQETRRCESGLKLRPVRVPTVMAEDLRMGLCPFFQRSPISLGLGGLPVRLIRDAVVGGVSGLQSTPHSDPPGSRDGERLQGSAELVDDQL